MNSAILLEPSVTKDGPNLHRGPITTISTIGKPVKSDPNYIQHDYCDGVAIKAEKDIELGKVNIYRSHFGG